MSPSAPTGYTITLNGQTTQGGAVQCTAIDMSPPRHYSTISLGSPTLLARVNIARDDEVNGVEMYQGGTWSSYKGTQPATTIAGTRTGNTFKIQGTAIRLHADVASPAPVRFEIDATCP